MMNEEIQVGQNLVSAIFWLKQQFWKKWYGIFKNDEDSKSNRGEAAIITFLVNRLLKTGISIDQIAVISPYAAQVQLINQMLNSKVRHSLLIDNLILSGAIINWFRFHVDLLMDIRVEKLKLFYCHLLGIISNI